MRIKVNVRLAWRFRVFVWFGEHKIWLDIAVRGPPYPLS